MSRVLLLTGVVTAVDDDRDTFLFLYHARNNASAFVGSRRGTKTLKVSQSEPMKNWSML